MLVVFLISVEKELNFVKIVWTGDRLRFIFETIALEFLMFEVEGPAQTTCW